MNQPGDLRAAHLAPAQRSVLPPALRRLLVRATDGREAFWVAVILVAMAVAMLRIALSAVPLGWDESVYASETRSFVTGVPTIWPIHRPPGVPILGLAAVPFGLGDASLRVIAAGFGILTLGVAWGLTRLMWGGLAAGIALVAVIVSPVVIDQFVLFQNDVPSAAAVLALMALLWWQFEVRERPNALLLAAGPLAAAAFYVRYGALALLAGVALAVVLLWPRRLVREARLVGATALVTVVLFLPHVVDAIVRTGSPLGIVRASVAQVDTSTPLQSIVQYARWMPSHLAGIAGTFLVIVAAIAAVVAAWTSIRDRRPTATARRLVWLLVPSAVAALGTVLVSHAEARYVLAALVLAEVAGAGAAAGAVAWLAGRLARGRPGAAGRVIPAILVVLVLVLAVYGRAWIRGKTPHTGDRWLVDAGHAIAADAGGTCTLVSSVGPIVGWYSGCAPIAFGDPATARTLAATGRPVYVVFTSLDAAQGAGAKVLARYRAELDMVPIATVGQASRLATVYRVKP